MNAYLQATRDRYDQVSMAIDEVVQRAEREGRDLTRDELAWVETRSSEATRLAEQYAELRDQELRNAAVADMAATMHDGDRFEPLAAPDRQSDPQRAFGELYPDGNPKRRAPQLMPAPDQLLELHRASQSGSNVKLTTADMGDGLHHRAAVTMSQVGEPVVATPGRDREPRRLAIASRLPIERVGGLAKAEFPVFLSGAADVVAEGATKPEYDNIVKGDATPALIAVWSDFTRQTVITVPSFEQRLRRKLAQLVARREDQLLVGRVLATTGILTHETAAIDADALLAAAAKVIDADIGEPTLAVVHPDDVTSVFGGSTGSQGESPEQELRLSVRGLQVYVSSAITQGEALVGAWPAAARYLSGLEPTWLIDAMSQLKQNLVTALLEQASTIAVDEPEGFVHLAPPS